MVLGFVHALRLWQGLALAIKAVDLPGLSSRSLRTDPTAPGAPASFGRTPNRLCRVRPGRVPGSAATKENGDPHQVDARPISPAPHAFAHSPASRKARPPSNQLPFCPGWRLAAMVSASLGRNGPRRAARACPPWPFGTMPSTRGSLYPDQQARAGGPGVVGRE